MRLPRLAATALALLAAPSAVAQSPPVYCGWPTLPDNAQPRPYSLSLPLQPRCASTSGGEEVRFSFQGYRNADPWLSVSLCDSLAGYDSKITVYRKDAYFGTLQPISRADDSACGSQAFAVWYPETTIYYVLIEGSFAGGVGGSLNVTVGNAQTPPTASPPPPAAAAGASPADDFRVTTVLGPLEGAGLVGDRGAVVSSSSGCLYSSWPSGVLARCPGAPPRLLQDLAVPLTGWPLRYGFDVATIDPRDDTLFAAAWVAPPPSPSVGRVVSSVVRIYGVAASPNGLIVAHLAGNGGGWAGSIPASDADARQVGLSGVTAMAFDPGRGGLYFTVAADGSPATSTLVALWPASRSITAHPYTPALPASAFPINAFTFDAGGDTLTTAMVVSPVGAAAAAAAAGVPVTSLCPAPASPNCGYRLAATVTTPAPGITTLPANAVTTAWLRSPSSSAAVLPLATSYSSPSSPTAWLAVGGAVYRAGASVLVDANAGTFAAPAGPTPPPALPSPGPWTRARLTLGGTLPLTAFTTALANWTGAAPLAASLHATSGRLFLAGNPLVTGIGTLGHAGSVARVEPDGNATVLAATYPLSPPSVIGRPDPDGYPPSKLLGWRTTAVVYDGARNRILLGSEDAGGLYRVAAGEVSRIGGRDALATAARAFCESCEAGVGGTSATVGLIRRGGLAVDPVTGDVWFGDDVTAAGGSGGGRLAQLRASDLAVRTFVSPDAGGGTPLLTFALDATGGVLYGSRGVPVAGSSGVLQWGLYAFTLTGAAPGGTAATALTLLPGSTAPPLGVPFSSVIFDAPRKALVALYGGDRAVYYDTVAAAVVRLEALPGCGSTLLDLTQLSAVMPVGGAPSGNSSARADLLGVHASTGRVVAVACASAPDARPGRMGPYGWASAVGEASSLLPGSSFWAAHLDAASKKAVLAHGVGDGVTGSFPLRMLDVATGTGAAITAAAYGTVLSGSESWGANVGTGMTPSPSPAAGAAAASASASPSSAAAGGAASSAPASASPSPPAPAASSKAPTPPPSASSSPAVIAAPSASVTPSSSPSAAASHSTSPTPSTTPSSSPTPTLPPPFAVVLSLELNGLPPAFLSTPAVTCPLLGLVAVTVGLPVLEPATWAAVSLIAVDGVDARGRMPSSSCVPLAATLPLPSPAPRLLFAASEGEGARALQAATTSSRCSIDIAVVVPADKLAGLVPRVPTAALRRGLASGADVTAALLRLPGSAELAAVLASLLAAARAAAAPAANSGGSSSGISASPNPLAGYAAALPSSLSASVSGVVSGSGGLAASLAAGGGATMSTPSSVSSGSFGAGFGAAVAVAVGLVVIAAGVVVMRRRRRAQQRVPGSSSGQAAAAGGAGSAGSVVSPAKSTAAGTSAASPASVSSMDGWVGNPLAGRLPPGRGV